MAHDDAGSATGTSGTSAQEAAGDAAPPYLRIRRRIAAEIASGELPRGTRLPSVRALAGEEGVAVNTVARAYKELEASGLVETRGRNGTVVTGRGAKAPERVLRAADALVRAAGEAGLELDAVLAQARAAWDRRGD